MTKTFTAVATLIGTAIGAGILGIPYVIMKSGFGIGLTTLILVGIISMLIVLYLGEIALRTKKNLHLSGYAEKYLGKKAKTIMFFAFIFGIYSALIAYLVGEGESLSMIFFQTTNYSIYFGIAFWLALSAITFFGLKALKQGEKLGLVVIILLVLTIIATFWNKIDPTNLTYNNLELFFAPFGVIVFAYLCFSAIPEVKRILDGERKNMKKTIIITYAAVFLIYAIFATIVIGSQGQNTPEIATISLGKIFILLGILAMFTSYLALTTAMIDMLKFDYKKSKNSAWFYTIIFPLIIYIIITLTKTATFTKILGIGGVICGGTIGAMILLMAKKAKKLGDLKPAYQIPYSKILTTVIILVLAVGTILEVYSTITS